jgi:hypothetical protein
VADDLGTELGRAKRIALLGLICVVVAALVLAIDYRLKSYIIREGTVAIGLLKQAQALAEEARGGTQGSGTAGAAGGGGVGAADGVGDDAGAGAHVDNAANGRAAAPARRKAGPVGGPRRDG